MPYISALFPAPFLTKTSGDRYAGEPQKLLVSVVSLTPSLAKPKSANLM